MTDEETILLSDEEIITQGELYGSWIRPAKPDKAVVNGSKSISRIAVVGGTKFDPAALESWMLAVRRKYPSAVVVTGSGRRWIRKEDGASMRDAEAATQDLAASHGLTVEVPEQDWWPDKLLQVEAILNGADVVVVVGSDKAARAAAAVRKHKLVDGWREDGRPLVHVAQNSKSPA